MFVCQHLGVAVEVGLYLRDRMSDPTYTPCFQLVLRLQKGGIYASTTVSAALQYLQYLHYRMARNFRGLKISRFSQISHEPRKFYPRKFTLKFFLIMHTAHTQCMVLLVST